MKKPCHTSSDRIPSLQSSKWINSLALLDEYKNILISITHDSFHLTYSIKVWKCVERQWVGEDGGHNNVCNTCLLRVLTILTFFDIIFVASWDVSTDKIQNCNCHKI